MDTSKLEGVQSAEGQEAKKAEDVSGEEQLKQEEQKTGELNAELLAGAVTEITEGINMMDGEYVGANNIVSFAEKIGDNVADALGIDLWDNEEWKKKLAEAVKGQGDSVTLMGIPIVTGCEFNGSGTEGDESYINLDTVNEDDLKKALKAFVDANPLPEKE